ncbi:MAG: DNA polymerase III subunit gamma/tau, partial [Candidatus Caldarchaeum sp.]
QEITRTISLDVLEIDGASNRRIEEVRTLRENVKFKPAHARFKIYIIDEVHMLTGEAFNALLKTLEEPPPHVKFIFATTEIHKVPLTILSRCQRFNFKRIPTEVIVKKLTELSHIEHLKADPRALFLIARASDGSLRDAETLLDQLSTLSEGTIREEDVLFALGLAGDQAYFNLFEALGKKDPQAILSLIQSLDESGKDLVQFGRGLFEMFRNLLFLQMGGGAERFIEMGEDSKKELARYKDLFTREELWNVLQNLWLQTRCTVLMVTHDLREAIYLSDIIYVMSKRPGTVIGTMVSDYPRPREIDISYEDRFVEQMHRLREMIQVK